MSNSKLDRRSFIKTAGIVTAGGAAATALATPAISQEMRELKMVTTWPKNLPGVGTGAQRLADRITAATEGKITVKLFAAGELVPPLESFDAVSSGTADMYHGAEYYWQGKHKAFNFFTAVPMGMTANELDAWINFGGGQELWDELSAQFGVKGLMAGNTGVQMGGWFRNEINSMEDMKGLKIRMPGLGGEVLRQIGAAAVTLPGGEVYPAFQAGTIDATEWIGPWNDLAFGFYKIAKNYYWPGFHEPGSGLSCGINKGVWDSFSVAEQEIVAACCAKENNLMYSEYNAQNGAALDTLINKHGVNLKQFPDEVFKALSVASAEVVNNVAEDDLGRRVLASFQASLGAVSGWGSIAEQAYLGARTKATM